MPLRAATLLLALLLTLLLTPLLTPLLGPLLGPLLSQRPPARQSALLSLLAALLLSAWARAQPAPMVPMVPTAARLQPAQLAIVINDADPDSVAIGEYYRRARGIAPPNIIHVCIPGKPTRLDPALFAALRAAINGQLSPAIEAVLRKGKETMKSARF